MWNCTGYCDDLPSTFNTDKHSLSFQEIQIGPDHQAEVPETMGPNYQDGELGQLLKLIEKIVL